MAFRLRAKNIFLTYPKANDIQQDLLLNFLQRDASYVIVARESHQDGTLHYHCGLQYNDILNITRADHFDFAGHHPNVQGSRNWRATTRYIRKYNDFIEWGTDSTTSPQTDLITLAKSGTPATTAIQQYLESKSTSIRGYRSLLTDYRLFSTDYHRSQQQPNELRNRFNACTVGNCVTFTFSTKFKSPKLYIWGPPNTGKTSLLTQYDERFIFNAPDNNDWTGFDPQFHKLIVFDEFHGQVPLSTLLKFMQGSKTRLNTKGGSIDCDKNLPMIFLSNIHAQRAYTHSDAFLARLRVHYMYAYHKIEL